MKKIYQKSVLLLIFAIFSLTKIEAQQVATNMDWTSSMAGTYNGIGITVAYTNMNSTGIGPSAVGSSTYTCNPLSPTGAAVEGSVASWGVGTNNPTPTATITFAKPVLDPIIYVQALDFRRFDVAGTVQTNGSPVVVSLGCVTGGITLTGTSLASDANCTTGSAVIRLTGLYTTINISRPWKCSSPNDGSNFTLGFRNDYGDAPISYGAPVHNVAAVSSLTLGATVDSEYNTPSLPGISANVDGADEDGVASLTSIFSDQTASQIIPSYTLTTTYNNTTGQAANYVAWIDWNNNGVFDAGEGQIATTPAGTTSGTVTFTWTNVTLINGNSSTGIFARIRVANDVITTTDTGTAFLNGEVEDYLIPITSDKDGDGLSDSDDLDDDNDGVSDAIEDNCGKKLDWGTTGSNYTAGSLNQTLSTNGVTTMNVVVTGATSTIVTLDEVTDEYGTSGGFSNGSTPLKLTANAPAGGGGALFMKITPSVKNSDLKFTIYDIDNFDCGVAGGREDDVRIYGVKNGVKIKPIASFVDAANASYTIDNHFNSNTEVRALARQCPDFAVSNPTAASTGANTINTAPANSEKRGSLDLLFPNGVDEITIEYYEDNMAGDPTNRTIAIGDLIFCEGSSDMDGDGLPNSCDLDSDGDGCSDAVEAGNATISQTTYTSTTTYPATPPAVTSSATYPYALNSSFNACADKDGDGVADLSDLDDDNDGILDSIENVCIGTTPILNTPPLTTNTDLTTNTGAVSGGSGAGHLGTANLNGLFGGLVNFSASLGAPTDGAQRVAWRNFSGAAAGGIQVATNPSVPGGGTFIYLQPQDGDNPTVLPNANNTARYTINLTQPAVNFSFTTGGINGNDAITYRAFYQGVEIPLSSSNFTDLSGGVTVAAYTLNGASGQFATNTNSSGGTDPLLNVLKLTIPGPVDRIEMTSGKLDNTNSTITLGMYGFGGCALPDTDGDGIPNSCDLDSDGDGCADAIEGGGNFVQSNLVTSSIPGGNSGTGYTGTSTTPITDNLGNTVNLSGVPTSAGSGQTIGSSNDNTINACLTTIAGTVFNDTNGGTDNTINGTGTNVGGQLFATLVDASNNPVATVPVSADGTYLFNNVFAGNYSVVLNTSPTGSTSPAVPTGYVNTGDNIGTVNNIATPGIVTGITAVAGVPFTNVNFGIEQPPTANTFTFPAAVNPGVQNTVDVSSGFGGTDQAGGIISSLTVTSFPTGATSITINGTVYTAANFPEGGVTTPTNAAGVPTTPILIDPNSGNVTIVIPYVTTDNAGVVSPLPGSVTAPFTTPANINISGSVLNDPLGGNVDNSTGTTNAVPSGLFAYLIEDGVIIATSPVSTAGAYSFPQIQPGTYSVLISTTPAIGTTPPPVTLPTEWVSTGEFNGAPNTGTDALINGISAPFTAQNVDVTNINFGIQQKPTAGTNTADPVLNPGGTTSASVPANTFSGTDFAGGTVSSILITTIPANATSITINGIKYDAANPIPVGGITIPAPGGVPTQPILVDPVDGAITVPIQYFTIDNLGAVSTQPGVANVPFVLGSLSGNVFNDANGLNPSPANTVDGTGTNITGSLNANLIDALGNVVATVPINTDGTYTFTGLYPGDYTVSINTVPGVVGSMAPAVVLPTGWESTGENNGLPTVAGSDGTANGISGPVSISNATKDVTNVNFGVQQPPLAFPVTAPTQVNPGGTTQVPVPPLNGTDPEDDVPTTLTIVSLPTNGILYYDGVPVVAGEPIPNFDPSKLTVDPIDGITTVTFPYTVTDAAGATSPPATVTMPFNLPPVANNDSDLANPVQSVASTNLLDDDQLGDGSTPLPADVTVDLDPSTPAVETTLTVSGQGVWAYNPTTGEVSFTPEATFNGDPTPIPYLLTETATGLSDPATITIDYVPVATDDSKVITDPTLPTDISPLTNDTTGDEVDPSTLLLIDPVTGLPATSVTVPTQGTWTVNPDGTVTFNPEDGFVSSPSPIDYVVADNDGNTTTATITLVAPPIANDDVDTTPNAPGTVGNVSLLPNDTTGDGTPALPAEVTIDLDPSTPAVDVTFTNSDGTYTVDSNGEVTFTPAMGFTGDPTPIPYLLTETATGLSDPATITIDYVPVATDDSKVITDPTLPTDISPLTNDTTGDEVDPSTLLLIDPVTGLPATSVTVPTQGTWTVNPDGTVTFDPEDGFVSSPAPIDYVVADNDGNTTTATITLVAPPIANDDVDTTPNAPGTVGNVSLLPNDTTGDGTPALPGEVTIDLDPSTPAVDVTFTNTDGTYTVDSNGEVTFTPAMGFTGDPTPIPYLLTETATGLSDPATITIDYVPVATDDSKVITDPTLPTDISPLTNDTTGDEVDPSTLLLIDPVTGLPATSVTVPTQGTWTVNPDGTVTFDPEDGFVSSPAPIDYVVADNDGNTTTATITLTAPEPPVAENDEKLAQPAGPVSVPLLPNDDTADGTDAQPSEVTIALTTTGLPMDAVVNPDGSLTVPNQGTWAIDPTTETVTFTPLPTFTGDPTPITYVLTETATGLTDDATVTITYICSLEIGGKIYIDKTGLTDGIGGDLVDGGALGLNVYMYENGLLKGSKPVSSTGEYLFTNVPAGTYTLTLSTTDVGAGTTTVTLPLNYIVVGEGGLVNNMGVSAGDGLKDGKTTIIVDCNSITYQNLRVSAFASYLENDFAIVDATSLPVSLIEFKAQKGDRKTLLNWKVSDEKDFSHYEVQKSTNAKEFFNIANVKGEAKSIYNSVDVNPNDGLNYYRLKMVNMDGTFSLSKIVQVNFEKSASFVTVENPSHNKVIYLTTNMNQPVFSLVSSNGTIITITKSVKVGNSYTIPIQLVDGVYTLIVQNKQEQIMSKLVIK